MPLGGRIGGYGYRLIPTAGTGAEWISQQRMTCMKAGNAGIIFGTGFAPFPGGPLHYVHARGSKALQERLHGLEYKYGRHFHASEGWAKVL